MKFIPRFTIDQDFWRSRYVWFANNQTGVPINSNTGNCFTYATARISEIVGEYTQLDGSKKVVGAGELSDNYNSCFIKSSLPVPGALAILGGNVIFDNDGKYHDYGHVCVIEQINEDGTYTWSQSNYLGKPFELVTGNLYTYYKPMYVKCFLIHIKLIEKEEVNKMKFTFQIENDQGKVVGNCQYYFDGNKIVTLHHPDEYKVLHDMYSKCYEKEMPHVIFNESAPYYKRLSDVIYREKTVF